MKRCMPCYALAVDAVPTCANCGEASFEPVASAPVAKPAHVVIPAPVDAEPTQVETAPAETPALLTVDAPAPASPAAPAGGTRWSRKGNR